MDTGFIEDLKLKDDKIIGHTVFESINFTYEWHIKNLTKSESYYKKTAMKSPRFHHECFKNLEWNLCLGYVSDTVLVYAINKQPFSIGVKLSGTSNLVDCTRNLPSVWNGEEKVFYATGKEIVSFNLESTEQKMIKDDTIVIRCEFEYQLGCDYPEPEPEPRTYLAELYKGPYSDMVLYVGDAKIEAHKSVLACRSDYFKAAFRHDSKEKKSNSIVIDDFEPQTIGLMLEYIYTDKVSFSEVDGDQVQSAANLLRAADKYHLAGLSVVCGRFLIDKIEVETALEFFHLAVLHNAKDLEHEVGRFIRRNFLELVKSPWWEMVDNNPELELRIQRLKYTGEI